MKSLTCSFLQFYSQRLRRINEMQMYSWTGTVFSQWRPAHHLMDHHSENVMTERFYYYFFIADIFQKT